MTVLWHDRREAGQALARLLGPWRSDPQALVLGLPRGGVVVAAELAQALELPLASWAVRKLAHPQAPELAIGAIAPGGVEIWEPSVLSHLPHLRLDAALRQRLLDEQRQELRRRRLLYGDPPAPMLHGRHLLVVDDGVATGLTVRAALQSLRAAEPARLVLAVPVIDRQVSHLLRPQLDGLVALAEVEDLVAVGAWYQRFEPVEDAQVLALLSACRRNPASSAAAVPPMGTADRP